MYIFLCALPCFVMLLVAVKDPIDEEVRDSREPVRAVPEVILKERLVSPPRPLRPQDKHHYTPSPHLRIVCL